MTGVVACFGEVLLRYSPPAPLHIGQASQFDVCTGGAEANVAVGLSQLGHRARMLSVLPDNALGARAEADLASHHVETGSILRRAGRMGSYVFTPPAGMRAGEVIYDRRNSAFARSVFEDFPVEDWLDGVSHLHLSGVTLALSPELAEASARLAQKARNAGASVSFDGNYRTALWGVAEHDARPAIAELFRSADFVFANHRDAGLLLGKEFSSDGSARRREAALALFEAFPDINAIASTARHIETVGTHRISARIDTPDAEAETDEWQVAGIVDRIGTGDAFAAGVLHSWLKDSADLSSAARSGLGMMALKHATWGDFPQAGEAELSAVISGHSDVKR